MKKKASELQKGDTFKRFGWFIYRTAITIERYPPFEDLPGQLLVSCNDKQAYLLIDEEEVDIVDLKELIGLTEKQLEHYKKSLETNSA